MQPNIQSVSWATCLHRIVPFSRIDDVQLQAGDKHCRRHGGLGGKINARLACLCAGGRLPLEFAPHLLTSTLVTRRVTVEDAWSLLSRC